MGCCSSAAVDDSPFINHRGQKVHNYHTPLIICNLLSQEFSASNSDHAEKQKDDDQEEEYQQDDNSTSRNPQQAKQIPVEFLSASNSGIHRNSPILQDIATMTQPTNTEQQNNCNQTKTPINSQPKQNSKAELITLRDQIKNIQAQLISIKHEIFQFNDGLNNQDSTAVQSLHSLRTDLQNALCFLYKCTQTSSNDDFDNTYSLFQTNINSTSDNLSQFTINFNESANSNYGSLQSIQTRIKSLNDSLNNTIDTLKTLIQDSKDFAHSDFNDFIPPPQIELSLQFEGLSTYVSGIKTYFERARASFSAVSGAKKSEEEALAQQGFLRKRLEELEKINQNLENKIQGQDLIIHHQSQLYQNMYQELFENISPNPTST